MADQPEKQPTLSSGASLDEVRDLILKLKEELAYEIAGLCVDLHHIKNRIESMEQHLFLASMAPERAESEDDTDRPSFFLRENRHGASS